MYSYRSVFASLVFVMGLPAWAVAPTEPPQTASASTAAAHNNPELRTFVQRVWNESPAVQGAHAAVDAASARSEGSASPLHNPSLELDAERTDINTTTIGLTQTIDWSDKQGALRRVADQDVLVMKAQLEQVRQDIAAETLAALARFYTARETQALARRGSQLMSGFANAAKRRQIAGDVEALDVTLAEVAYGEALMALAASESELAEAEAALQAVSGLVDIQWPALPDELAAPPDAIDPSWLEGLPELIILRRSADAANARLDLAKREGRVDPTIGLRAGREDTETLVGLSIEIPLFVRNDYSSSARAAAHDVVAEEQAYRDAYRRANARLSGALGRYKNATRAWRAWLTTGRDAQREQMDLLEKLWAAGELSATDFLVQSKQNIDTQAAATALNGQVWEAAIAWLSAAGQIERWLGFETANNALNLGASK